MMTLPEPMEENGEHFVSPPLDAAALRGGPLPALVLISGAPTSTSASSYPRLEHRDQWRPATEVFPAVGLTSARTKGTNRLLNTGETRPPVWDTGRDGALFRRSP